MSDFYSYFKENMDALGLPAPEALFGSVQSTITTATAIFAYVDKFGEKVTLRELIGAGTRLEKLGTAGACTAAFYVGAVIGSLAVATGRTLGRGTSLSDVLFTAVKWGFQRPWLASLLRRLPGIYDPSVASRTKYKHVKAFA